MILCQDLSVHLGGQPLVEGASIEVAPGTVTALVGPSGIGKTVLAEVIFGLRSRTKRDAVRVVGGSPGPAAAEGALVFQQGGGIGQLTPLENLRLVRDDEPENRELLRRLGLMPADGGDPDQAAHSLSVGEARRLAVALGVAAGRRLLWVDEPAAGLDLVRTEVLAGILRDLADQGAAVLVTSHQPELIHLTGAENMLFFDAPRIRGPEPTPPTSDAVRQQIRGFLQQVEEKRQQKSTDPEAKARKRSPGKGPRSFTMLHVVPAIPAELRIGLASLGRAIPEKGWDVRAMLGRAVRLAAIQGAHFCPLVGAIFGLVFILVLKISIEPLLSATAALANYGPMFVVRFSPAMAGILVAARAGASISAWIGQITYSRQLDALRLLREDLEPRLAGPGWAGLLVGGLTGTLSFALSVTAVFCVYLAFASGGATVSKLMSNFEAARIAAAALKTVLYSAAVAAATMASARQPKLEMEDVAADLTDGIVVSTVLVMLLEALLLAGEWGREALL